MEFTGDVLLVCSGGGHLRQLDEFVRRIGIPVEQQAWVTFENALSTSLLAGRRVEWAPYTGPRDLRHFALLMTMARRMLGAGHPFEAAVSTGAAPAVAFLPRAASAGAEAHYIESAARADGPSLSGRFIERLPGIMKYTQYPAWADERWQYRGSIFDRFEPAERTPRPEGPRRAVVSVGTQEGYPFTRMLDAVVPLLRDMDEVLYQTGDADMTRYGLEGRSSVPHDEIRDAVNEADVVITHSGVGAALTALELGRHPILIPRSRSHREHIDDHQTQIARELERRGLATMRTPDTIAYDDIVAAGTRSVRTVEPQPFQLRSRSRVH